MQLGVRAGRLSVEVFMHDSVLVIQTYFLCLNYDLKMLQQYKKNEITITFTVHIVIYYYNYYY